MSQVEHPAGIWKITSTPTITANWDADSSDRWTVPFGAGVGRVIKIGNQPIDLKGQAFWNAEKPHGTSDLAFQFQVKFLFPK